MQEPIAFSRGQDNTFPPYLDNANVPGSSSLNSQRMTRQISMPLPAFQNPVVSSAPNPSVPASSGLFVTNSNVQVYNSYTLSPSAGMRCPVCGSSMSAYTSNPNPHASVPTQSPIDFQPDLGTLSFNRSAATQLTGDESFKMPGQEDWTKESK